MIGLSPGHYNEGGFQIRYYGPAERANLDLLGRQSARDIGRMALRCAHTLNYRFYQYVNEVRALTTTRYVYEPNASSDRFVAALRSGRLQADDADIACDTAAEDAILDLISAQRWELLWKQGEADARRTTFRRLKRRLWLRPVEKLRNARPRGDF